jgi:hypothetical protein
MGLKLKLLARAEAQALAHDRARPAAARRPITGQHARRRASPQIKGVVTVHVESFLGVVMILPQVHLRKPCYDFTFL